MVAVADAGGEIVIAIVTVQRGLFRFPLSNDISFAITSQLPLLLLLLLLIVVDVVSVFGRSMFRLFSFAVSLEAHNRNLFLT